MPRKTVEDNAFGQAGVGQQVRAPRQSQSDFFTDDVIGRSLKAYFDDISQAPIPDKFLALLAELEAKEKSDDR